MLSLEETEQVLQNFNNPNNFRNRFNPSRLNIVAEELHNTQSSNIILKRTRPVRKQKYCTFEKDWIFQSKAFSNGVSRRRKFSVTLPEPKDYIDSYVHGSSPPYIHVSFPYGYLKFSIDTGFSNSNINPKYTQNFEIVKIGPVKIRTILKIAI